MDKPKIILVIFILIGFMSCENKSESYSLLEGYAQGSTFRIVYKSNNSSGNYIIGIDSLIAVMDKSMSLWDSTSVIRAVNASDVPIKVDEHFKNVFNRSGYFYEISKGAFDPTLGPLISAWGFARKNKTELPKDNEVQKLKALIGLEKFRLDGKGYLHKSIPNAEINFNAIAQGYSVDKIGAFLEARGVSDYMVELGGEILTKGLNQSGEKWKLGIDRPDFNPTSTKNAVQTVIGLSDEALVTSGSYRKFIEKDGKKYSHTLDAKTGKPVIHNLLSVAVITKTAMDADAYATMFMVMGKDSAIAYANEHKIKIQCIYDEDGVMKTAYSNGFMAAVIKEH